MKLDLIQPCIRPGSLIDAELMKTKALLAILICLCPLSRLSADGPVPDFPFIHASGEAKREVAPTKAEVEFHVLAFSKTSEEATDTVQNSLSKLLSVLKEAGIKEDQIRAHDFQKSASRNRTEKTDEPTEIIGYQVSREVQLKLPELSNYPKIVRILMTTEHVTNLDSSFDTDKRDEIEAELTSEACAKARKKADLLAKGAGVTISGVHAVGQPDVTYVGQHFGFSRPEAFYGGSSGNEEAPVFAPATIKIATSVSILYNLNSPRHE